MSMCVYIYVCIYMCVCLIYIYMYVYIYVYICVCVCVCVDMHSDRHTCLHSFIHSYRVGRDAFIPVTWILHMLNATHSYVWHDSFKCVTCVTWLIYTWDTAHILLCVCVCMCVCMYVYGFLYESMYVRLCVRVYACIHAHSNRHAYIYTYIHTHTHTCICWCMHLQAQYFNVHAYTRIHMTSMLINLKKKTNKIFIWYSLVSIRAAVASLFRQVCGLLFIYIHELTTLYEGQL